MNVLIAVDSFKGSLSSLEAGDAVKTGILNVTPDAYVRVCPLADGGEGTVEALTLGMGGRLEPLTVTGPLGEPIKSTYGIIENSKTAVIEMSAAAGITLISKEEKNPLYTTTYGVGEIIKDAIQKGCRHFIVGIGGSATNDGENGCSAIFGPQKGATPEMIKDMDSWLLQYAKLASEKYEKADENYPGTGAAGGLGFAFLAFTNAVLESGAKIVFDETKLEDYIKEADLVITGEGMLDSQTVMGKAPISVAKLAKKYEKKVIAFAGSVSNDACICNEYGIDAFFPILRNIQTLEDAMEVTNAKVNMVKTVEQVFRVIKYMNNR